MYTIRPIAHIATDFPEKFGIPRQSGLVKELTGKITFAPEYRDADAVRGLEQYSHIWLIWSFSGIERDEEGQPPWHATVRPPRLGGNTRMGVFATRSPFRPNGLGLSCVKLERIGYTERDGAVLWVKGADLMDGTPIVDIKPYLPYVDCIADAVGGFTDGIGEYRLRVECPEELLAIVPEEKREALLEVLAEDVRPAYQQDEGRMYGMDFAGLCIKFRVVGEILKVESIGEL